MVDTVELEAAAFRRLLRHLNEARPDVQNIDLMILAGFCRNCLADWYREAAEAAGQAMDKEQAREAIYGMPFAEWKARHQAERILDEVEQLFPKVSEIISGSDFGQDAVKKARGVIERTRGAIAARDLPQLTDSTEALTRTLNMFRGVVSKTRGG